MDVQNIVASTTPVYIYSAFDKVDGIDFTTEGSKQFHYDGWDFIITVASQRVNGYCWTRSDWELTGLYDQDIALVPVAANIQTSEPPLLVSKDSSDKYMRTCELFTTERLSRNEALDIVHYAQPTLPGFAGGDLVDAFMNPEQVISGRSTTYAGNANFYAPVGFMSPVHQCIIGEGEPCASPDLHYIRACYFDTNLNAGTSGFTLDLPAARDILTVAKHDMTKDPIGWAAQVIRGARLDVVG